MPSVTEGTGANKQPVPGTEGETVSDQIRKRIKAESRRKQMLDALRRIGRDGSEKVKTVGRGMGKIAKKMYKAVRYGQLVQISLKEALFRLFVDPLAKPIGRAARLAKRLFSRLFSTHGNKNPQSDKPDKVKGPSVTSPQSAPVSSAPSKRMPARRFLSKAFAKVAVIPQKLRTTAAQRKTGLNQRTPKNTAPAV